MATATVQTVPKEIQRQKPSVTLVIKIPRPLLTDLQKMFRCASRGEASETLESYISDLVSVEVAEFRKMRIRPELSFVDSLGEEADAADKDAPSVRKLSPLEAQRVIHLYFSEGVPIRDIAVRLSRGRSSIRRVIDAYEQREHHDFALIGRRVRHHGLNLGDLHAPANLSHNDRF